MACKEILSFIVKYRLENGVSPRLVDIKNSLGIKSSNQLDADLTKLEKDGQIKRTRGIPRGISVLSYEVVQEIGIKSPFNSYVMGFDGS